jgi:predicted permease
MQAKPLFLFAALFNFVAGGALLFGYPVFAPILGIEGPPTVFFHVAMGIVLVFGCAYWLIAREPATYRPYVALGAIAKMVFVVAIYAHWLAGTASTPMAVLVTGDLVFAALFVRYLRATGRR